MLSKHEIRTLIFALILAFLCGMIVGMSLKVLGVDAAEIEDRERIEGGAMPCMAAEVAAEKIQGGAMPCLEPVSEPKPAPIPIYSVNGSTLSPDLQRYLYGQLEQRGIEYMYELALCQIYQESRYNTFAVSSDGQDKGLCQFRERYWPGFATKAGLVQFDIFNPIDQLYVYAWIMGQYMATEGNASMALSKYFTGNSGYCDSYVTDVMKWTNTIKKED